MLQNKLNVFATVLLAESHFEGGGTFTFLPVLCKLKWAGVYSREGFVKAWRLFSCRKYDCLAINGAWGRVRMGCYTRLNYVYLRGFAVIAALTLALNLPNFRFIALQSSSRFLHFAKRRLPKVLQHISTANYICLSSLYFGQYSDLAFTLLQRSHKPHERFLSFLCTLRSLTAIAVSPRTSYQRE